MSELHSFSLFDTILYKAEVPEYLKNKDFMSVCDEHTDQAISNAKKLIDKRNKKFKIDVKDHGMSYHSGAEMYKDERFHDFELLIRNTARNILENQGFDLSNYSIDYTEMWIQKFAYEGGGHQDTHVHWDNHVSGFYFVECSERTSKPVFHDPRAGRMMLNLPIKDHSKLCPAMERQIISVKPGTLLLFNSWLPHQFSVDNGIDPFRFIHFNLQAKKHGKK
jgi:uncharacterized protein (TIGR02466 family)|tara:strand:- start:127 stop:789 length:663 start_codon:yes stop_codon:yes gene_type:complete